MAGKNRISRIDGLAGEVLVHAGQASRKRLPAFATAREEITRLEHREYGRSLRDCFARAEVREIVREARAKAWPHLNRDAVRLGSMREFADRAYSLGADFQIAKMSWPSGLALFGFYLKLGPGSQKRPIICVNAAHHRAVVGTAFAHEVGHHVTASLFGMRAQSPLPSLYTGYESHLDDPLELAADIAVSLGMYPRKTALKLFPESESETVETNGQRAKSSTPAAALEYVRREYGLDLASLPTQKRIQYRAALTHFTKLREALLHEYDF
ncbi:MAG TPA: hypothetical protein VNO74_00550 [Methylomirabilota bacterium]|nr:hypothetical protein [Methylomirabilota bacterium]